MQQINFKQVDVFTTAPYKGNPVAVIMDARGLSDSQMQSIASWTNLSETTFVLPAQDHRADYRVRIFTPASELPFAGHPTLGTAYALLESGSITPRDGVLIQECAAGLIELNVTAPDAAPMSISFRLPEPVITPLTPAQTQELEEILGCPIDRSLAPARVDVGARWVVAKTTDAAQVLATTPDFARLAQHDAAMNITGICLYGLHAGASDMHIEARSFAPSCGVNEDPVCGSGNGSIAAFMRHHQVALPDDGIVRSSQGQKTGRDGKLVLRITRDHIYVGGHAVTCISGKICS